MNMKKISEGIAALLIGVALVVLCAVRFGFSDWSLWTARRMLMLFMGIVFLIAAPVYLVVGLRSQHDRRDTHDPNQ